jgi:hypothetical protein
VEHKLINGGEQYLPFARSRIKALRATGLKYASQQFVMPDGTVRVQIVGDQEYIRISGGKGVVAYVQDVRFPETEKTAEPTLGSKVKLRRGHYANPIYTSACSVSPFSNKNITVTVVTGTDTVIFDGFTVLRKTLTASIDGVVVSTLDVSGHSLSLLAASSLSDSAAVVVQSYVGIGPNGGLLNSITAFSAEYVLDAQGVKLLDGNNDPLLTYKETNFSGVPTDRLEAQPTIYPVLNESGVLVVLTYRSSASDYDYRYSLRVSYGTSPTSTAQDVFTLSRNNSDSGPPGVVFMAVSGNTAYVGYYHFVGSERRTAVAVIQIKTDPFSALLVKTVELGPSVAGFSTMHNGTVTAVRGLLWGMQVCVNAKAGTLIYLPNPLKIPPNYIAVSGDGKTATYYWTAFSPANVALAGIDMSNPNYNQTPMFWPTDSGSTNVDFLDGSAITYTLNTADDGTQTIAEVEPADPLLKIIPGTRYHHVPVAPFPCSALQFKRP